MAAIERCNPELFTLTYGAVVRLLLTDYEGNVEDVNVQLEKMGFNIGLRLVDEYIAKTGQMRCKDFRDTADTIAKVAFKMFLGITANVSNWTADGTECSLTLDDNPLVDFVELPEEYSKLSYCNLLCGVIRGALEQVDMKVSCAFVRDTLRGDEAWEIRLKLLETVADTYPFNDDD